LLWLTWSVYSDGEFDFVWMLVTHTALFIGVSALLVRARFVTDSGRLGNPAGVLVAATGLGIAAVGLGAIFAVVELSGVGVPLVIVPATGLMLVAGASSTLAIRASMRTRP
jgi:hypothetical protein